MRCRSGLHFLLVDVMKHAAALVEEALVLHETAFWLLLTGFVTEFVLASAGG